VGRTSIFSACLYLSSVTIWLATRSHKKGNTTWWRNWLLLTIGLGATFIYGEVSEYYGMAADQHMVPSSDVFATSFYSLTGFHGLHVLTGLLLLSILFVLTLAGKFSRGANKPAVMVITTYWHFVDAVWLVIFPTVYLWTLAGP
jgi:heme/copper-type cytochrome/quinol oxidase subunit 3